MGKARGQGVAGEFKGSFNAGLIKADAQAAGKALDLAVAATTAHEVVFHGMGAKRFHYHNTGYVDATAGGQIGADFSPEAARLIVDRLDIEKVPAPCLTPTFTPGGAGFPSEFR